MRRFLLLVFVSCTALAVAFSLWPRQLGGVPRPVRQDAVVNSGAWP